MTFDTLISLLPPACALVFAPLMLGIVNRTKAKVAGRVGPPLAQPYYDLVRLLGKSPVYSQTTTWVFRAGPIVSLAAILMTTFIVPFGNCPALLSFPGDLVLVAYLFGVGRLMMVVAALDTGSSFEGMGASREVIFSALAEPALLLGLASVALAAVGLEPAASASAAKFSLSSLSEIYATLNWTTWTEDGFALALVSVALMVVFLTENSRIPVDDPNTHLELTMIHEVMVLDHSGPDLAYIIYGAALKLWVLGALVIQIMLPFRTGQFPIDLVMALGGMFLLPVMLGIIESTMARLRLVRVPQLLVSATALSALALALEYNN
jgi:formate hydrogenlyase subunit 4